MRLFALQFFLESLSPHVRECLQTLVGNLHPFKFDA